MKNLIIIFLLFSFTYCQSEQDRCYEDYGISTDSRTMPFPCFMYVSYVNELNQLEITETRRQRAQSNSDAALALCAYTFLVDSECSKKSKIKRDTKDPFRLE